MSGLRITRDDEAERSWAVAMAQDDAERGFRHALMDSFLRRLVAALRRREEAWPPIPGMPPLAGYVDESGALCEGPPRLARPLAEAWMREYLRGETEGREFALREGPQGLYLVGGALSLLRLCVAAQKGQEGPRIRVLPRRLRTFPETAADRGCCSEQEGSACVC